MLYPEGVAKRTRRTETELKHEPAPAAILTPPAVPFSSVVGQDGAIAVLQNALTSGRVHHAWIFHGPRGVGKFTTAMAFAGALLDPGAAPGRGGRLEFNAKGPVGRLLATGAHPDLHVITKELARYSDDSKVRDAKLVTIPKDVVEKHLLIPASLAPTMRTGSRVTKVFIVDEAELLDRSPFNAPTQNAILKTLEEPPEGTVIILITDAEDQLLATIRSRCQRVAFRRLDPAAMDAWLAGTDLGVPAAQRTWLLEHAAGSPGVFKEGAEHGLYAWHETLSPMLRTLEGGRFVVELGGALASCAESWAESWVGQHKNASKDAANRDGAARVLHLLGEHFRRGLGGAREPRPYLDAIDAVSACGRHADASVNLALAMGNLSAQLSEIFAPAR